MLIIQFLLISLFFKTHRTCWSRMMHLKNKTQFSNILFCSSLFFRCSFQQLVGPCEIFLLPVFPPGRTLCNQGTSIIRKHTQYYCDMYCGKHVVTLLFIFPFHVGSLPDKIQEEQNHLELYFFVVLVFAKFSIKSIQHASKSFPHSPFFKSRFF